MEESDNVDEPMIELLAAHGRVGRSGRTRKTKKNVPKNSNTDSEEMTKVIREQLAAEMEEKMKIKLRKIFEKLGEMNPALNINVEELCAENSEVDADGEEDEDGEEDGDGNELDGDGDETSA